MIELFVGSELLKGDVSVVDALAGLDHKVITVVTKACALHPDEYEEHLVPNRWWSFSENFYAYDQSCRIGHVEFPTATGIKINMMPFVIGDKSSIPDEYLHYWPLIEACCPNAYKEGRRDMSEWSEFRKIGYLTIDEQMVVAGEAQRRPGLHTESPGIFMNEQGAVRFHWGNGYGDQGSFPEGGIYMASNVANSCRIWEVVVKEPGQLIGHLGDLEHIRSILEAKPDKFSYIEPDAGELVWISDTTPHESLNLEVEGERQFFRLVTSQVSAWYAQHSTKNPLGIVPDPAVTRIIEDNKFELPTIGAIRKFAGRVW